MLTRFLCISIFCGVILLQSLSSSGAQGKAPIPADIVESTVNKTPSAGEEEFITLRIPKDLLPADAAGNISPSPDAEGFITLRIPLFSPSFDDIPVALIDDEPVTMYHMSKALAQRNEPLSGHPEEREKEYRAILDRLINSRLVVLEAMNIGLHELPEVQGQVESFKRNILQAELINLHLEGLEPDPAAVEEVYQKISREAKLYSLVFPVGPGARQFLEEVKDTDFDQLAKRYIDEGKATVKKDEAYVALKDLRPEIAQEVYSMDIGGLSKIYLTEEGHLLYRLVDTRFIEDQDAREEAVRKAHENMRREKAMEYGFMLEEKYFTLDEDSYKQLDFNTGLEQLLQDERVLARTRSEEDSFTVTVADLAAKMKSTFFHGADKAARLEMINVRKDATFANMLFQHTSALEARHLGLDQTEGFKRKVEEFEFCTIFSAFMSKLILPDVKLTEEEIRAYYDEHIDEYSSPAMLQMKSLVFNNLQDAESAHDKLRKGAEYNWVSANSANLVDPDTSGILPLDKNLLSLTSLPEDLQELAEGVKKGDTLVYAPAEGKFFYVLLMDNVFPPEPQPYDQAKSEIAQYVHRLNTEKLLDEWTSKLKEVYPVQIFLSDSGQ